MSVMFKPDNIFWALVAGFIIYALKTKTDSDIALVKMREFEIIILDFSWTSEMCVVEESHLKLLLYD